MTHAMQRPTSPEVADLRRQLLRLVRAADQLDAGTRLQLATTVDDMLERLDDEMTR